jgi:uncharacterized protein YbjT (DUF2867 family)
MGGPGCTGLLRDLRPEPTFRGSRCRRATSRGALAGIAIAEPLNETVELAGPEPVRMDELIRRYLSAKGDSRKVITDPQALYYGVKVNDQNLTPGAHPRLGPTRFED